MQISRINSSNIYAANAVSMKARMTNEAALKNFNNLLKDNNVFIQADLKPDGKGGYEASIELTKYGYTYGGKAPVTDENGYTISGRGKNLNAAITDIIKTYRGSNAYYYKNGSTPIFTIPNYII